MHPSAPLCLLFLCSCGWATAQISARPRLIYQGGPDVDYLRIERLPDPHIVPIPTRPVTIKTRKGDVKLYRVLSGNCNDLFSRLLTTPRVSVEVKDDSYYSILSAHGGGLGNVRKRITRELATTLGLSMEWHSRKMYAHVLSDNGKERTGVSEGRWRIRWPEVASLKPEGFSMSDKVRPILVRSFAGGGCVFVRTNYGGGPEDNDENIYFEDISFDELADFFEDRVRWVPVVNRSADKGRYSFSLPQGTYKNIMFTEPYSLPGLGLSVEYRQVEIDVIVVRERKPPGDDRPAAARDWDAQSSCIHGWPHRCVKKRRSRRTAHERLRRRR